jgi:phytoene desaturase (3,4-didehydrolycopene-forming)
LSWHPGSHVVSQGPSLLLLPSLFRDIYTDLSTDLPSHLDLIKCEPNYVIHYHDGESITLSTDRAKLRAEVERFEGPKGGKGLEGFLSEAETHAQLSHELVLSKTFNSYLSLLRPSFLVNAIALHPLESIWSRTSRYFKTER